MKKFLVFALLALIAAIRIKIKIEPPKYFEDDPKIKHGDGKEIPKEPDFDGAYIYAPDQAALQ